MESVTELMKEGGELIVGDKRWRFGSRLCKVCHNAYERPVLNSVNDTLATEFSHPCTTSLACSREEISIKECKMAAILILYIIYLYILVIYRYIVKRFECDAVKTVGKVEHSIDAVLKLEIWLELLCIQRVFRFLITLRPE